ncbi:hypothetical protein [Thermomonospora amylolytica]|uniref:hypothetical protein n=1 Tax=Thermomonospora amylolytica TaxID=1411117 RepID=UPI000E6C65EF|nr:hypothetical protein [Thermomonospora amylolytica]
MRYPGDQGNSGEPTAPYGPGADPHGPEQAGDGRPGQDGSPFAPPPGAFAARPGESFDGGFDDRPYAPGGFDAPGSGPEEGGRYAADPGDTYAYQPQPGPSYGAQNEPGPLGQGHPGPQAFDAPAGPYEPYEPSEPHTPTYYDAPHEDGLEPERRRSTPLVAVGAVVAGLLLAGGGFAVSSMLTGGDTGEPAAAAEPTEPATASPTPTEPPAPLNVKLKDRASDPEPLTLAEVFGTQTFKEKGTTYLRTAWKHDRDCAKGVTGAKLEAALKKGGCNQVLRASYARRDGSLIGTVGVLNLKTEQAAKNAAKAGAGRDAYLQPLPAKKGVTRTLGKGVALGTVYARGHYLIMTWVQRPDGKEIGSKDHKKVTAFQQQVILGSNLGKALHYRGIEGKPLTS